MPQKPERSARPRAERPLARELSNPLCRRCLRGCRQPLSVTLVACPRFLARPFPIATGAARQLELFPPAKSR